MTDITVESITRSLTDQERAQAAYATAYVTSRFYPPLDAAYGPLAVIAIREFKAHGPEAPVNLPKDLVLLPSRAREDDDGDLFIEAVELIRILRLEHMVADDEHDEDEI